MCERMVGLLFAVLFLFSAPAAADVLKVSDCWSRASIPGADTGVTYCSLKNEGKSPLVIEKVTSEVAGMIMIHETVHHNDMVMMSHLDELTIEPGEEVQLKPGGLHMMLTGMTRTLIEKDVFQIDFLFADGSTTTADVRVGSIGQITLP